MLDNPMQELPAIDALLEAKINAAVAAKMEPLEAEIAALKERNPEQNQDPRLVALRRFEAADPSSAFNVRETALITGFSVSTLNANRSKSWPDGVDLAFIRRGSRIAYLKSQIEVFLNTRHVTNTAQARRGAAGE